MQKAHLHCNMRTVWRYYTRKRVSPQQRRKEPVSKLFTTLAMLYW
uniref:Transposase n=1 Tax=Dulem virus 42 TaxID=3145760 RepID=A0AAU8B803_9CAUD